MSVAIAELSPVNGRIGTTQGVLEALDLGLTHPNQASDWRAAMQSTQPRKRKFATEEERFWSKVDKTDSCWEWTAHTKYGYGYFSSNPEGGPRKSWRAHRFAWTILCGPIPEGLQLDHLCRNRKCVNPDHLEPVTARVNTLRSIGVTAINARKVRCKRGHEFTEANTYVNSRGGRECRACKRLLDIARQARRSPEVCDECGVTASAGNLKRHKRLIHGGSKP